MTYKKSIRALFLDNIRGYRDVPQDKVLFNIAEQFTGALIPRRR